MSNYLTLSQSAAEVVRPWILSQLHGEPVSLPAFAGTKLQCLVTEATHCEEFA